MTDSQREVECGRIDASDPKDVEAVKWYVEHQLHYPDPTERDCVLIIGEHMRQAGVQFIKNCREMYDTIGGGHVEEAAVPTTLQLSRLQRDVGQPPAAGRSNPVLPGASDRAEGA